MAWRFINPVLIERIYYPRKAPISGSTAYCDCSYNWYMLSVTLTTIFSMLFGSRAVLFVTDHFRNFPSQCTANIIV
jgi:hypothetical protein